MKKVLLVLVLLWPVTVLADFSEGLAAAQRGDFATAMREWRPLAEAGNAVAQYNLGQMYANGEGVPEDYVQAYAWHNLAAAQGNKGASTSKDIIRKLMTSAQIARAQKLSKKLCASIPNCAK